MAANKQNKKIGSFNDYKRHYYPKSTRSKEIMVNDIENVASILAGENYEENRQYFALIIKQAVNLSK